MSEIESTDKANLIILRQALVNYRRKLAADMVASPALVQKQMIASATQMRDVQADIEMIDRALADEAALARQG
ncbi:hypothetical protein [Zavarzinia sp. CC-PAN008]|uniref:hypothetical protein n=1 Tax=Zavarzinia sp. CC-PAN008 TaxID=3243332 RepID=UPI003F7461DB